MKKISENVLQRSLHSLLSDPSKIYSSVNNNRLQILSPGSLNHHEGPDFKDSAVLINGTIRVGDIEFHRKSSEWFSHNHNDDVKYENVILHIVCENDKIIENNFDTLIIDEKILLNNLNDIEKSEAQNNVFSLEELQHYSLVRLLRKTANSQNVINRNDLDASLKLLADDYLIRYFSRRRRPTYNAERLKTLSENILQSKILQVLEQLDKSEHLSIPDTMSEILKSKISDEGPHLRREIILNAVLPMMLCLADEKSRIDLFLWYWSTPALNQYGVLKRKFPDLPQNYIWQQQGMLEYIKLYGKKQNVVAESIKTYGFAQVLSFYQMGNSPFRTIDDE